MDPLNTETVVQIRREDLKFKYHMWRGAVEFAEAGNKQGIGWKYIHLYIKKQMNI